jgi:hypothetical protein
MPHLAGWKIIVAAEEVILVVPEGRFQQSDVFAIDCLPVQSYHPWHLGSHRLLS